MKKTIIFALLIVSVPFSLWADDSKQSKSLNDPLLDQLIGDWNLVRKFGNGRTAKNIVHVEWVLHHQFVELHYRDSDPSGYEAIVLIGYDGAAKRYVCHWTDNFGANYSADGFAPHQENSNAIEFKFAPADGDLTNRFAFHPDSGTWTSTIRQTENGEWKLFCEDTFTRVAQGSSPAQ